MMMRLVENLSYVPANEFISNRSQWDIFITCGSFEERCIRSSCIFNEKKSQLKTSIIFDYKETDSKHIKERNISIMKEKLINVSENVFIFDVGSVSSPSLGIKNFIKFLENNNIEIGNKTIIVDITVFTKPYFYLLFKMLYEKYHINKFNILYTEPEIYLDGKYKSNELILTEGTDHIKAIPGFEGSSINNNDILIVILGYEGRRSLEVFNDITPEITYAINGFPSYQPGWHKISLDQNMQFLVVSSAYHRLFYAAALDPFETNNLLNQILGEIDLNYTDYNIIIAPLGTKVQAFGALLFSLKNKKIKVIYPFPSTYKPNISQKYLTTWIYKINLDNI
jgi:hypothetical protein